MKNSRHAWPLAALLVLATGCGAGAPHATGPQEPRTQVSAPAAGADRPDAPTSATRGPADVPSRVAAPHDAAPPKGPRGMPTRSGDGNQAAVLDNLPGSTGPGCVTVGDERDVAAGGFAAGPFDAARRGYRAANLARRDVRLYFVPVHSAAMPGLTLQLSDEAGASFTVTQQHWADADEFRFYDTQVAFPHGGLWRISAAAGADAGCWLVRI